MRGFRRGICGSSPRGRGTLVRRGDDLRRVRFIPAWAGNAPHPSRPPRPPAVHPRVGGERAFAEEAERLYDGSSPRGRGTPQTERVAQHRLRFIPAWAGNALERSFSRYDATVHPRVGGERWDDLPESTRNLGSSPRGRGTPARAAAPLDPLRFIPAWAGNARSRDTSLVSAAGSSPRGRGTRRTAGRDRTHDRFIPAWAGNAGYGDPDA